MGRWLALFAVLALCIAPAWAYIDVGGDRVTLPEVLFEFPHVAVLTIDKMDASRGAVIFKTDRILQGKVPEKLRQALQDDGKLPKELRELKVGDRVVYFAGSVDERSLVLTSVGWYLTTTKNAGTDGWERYVGTRPDMETVFAGSPDELARAVADLRAGKSVTVRIRPKGAKPDARVFLRCDLLAPHHRWPARDAARVAATQRTAKEWAADLAADDVGKRQQAAIALAELGPDAANDSASALLTAAKDPIPDVRSAVCEAIGAVRPDAAKAIPVLVKALADSDRFVCASAARALAAFGDKSVVSDLEACLKDRDWAHDFRPFRGAAAAEAILTLTPDSSATVTAVRFLQDRLLKDNRPDSYGTRTAGAVALAKAGPTAARAADALTEALADRDPHTRVAAAFALLRVRPTEKNLEAIKVLTVAATDKDPLVRLHVARAVAGRDSLADLRKKLAADSSPIVREAAK